MSAQNQIEQEGERRADPRYPGQTLLIEVDGELCPLIDLSSGGVSFEGMGFQPQQRILVRIASVLDGDDAVEAECVVAKICDTRIGASFLRPTPALLHYVVRHIGNVRRTEAFVAP